MYYILNQTKQIIGASDALLKFCGLAHIDTLCTNITLGKLKFDLDESSVVITTQMGQEQFATTQTTLATMLGEVTLVALQTTKEVSQVTSVIDEKVSEPSLDMSGEALFELDLDSNNTPLEEPQKRIEPQEKRRTSEDEIEMFDLLLDDEPLEAISTSVPAPKTEPKEEPEAEIALFDLEVDKKSSTIEPEETPESTEPILIDITTVSEQIGISTEDYESFLDEYIDTALELEPQLHNSNIEVRKGAMSTLENLGEILQLPTIGTLLEKISTVDDASLEKSVVAFYNALGRLSTTAPIQEPTSDKSLESTPSIPQEPVIAQPKPNEKSFGQISLEGIKPIHFDFRLEEAANDLSLPVELIEEFVNDFIEQAHIETKKMLEAYEQGDLDTIQKIGHLLKGASSNLRINPLSDTLYEIQFCEDPSLLEGFIKEYWGHFLSFEIQINALAK